MAGNETQRLTMKQAASHLGHSYSWLYQMHRSLGLKAYRIGARWYFDLNELQAWEENLKINGQIVYPTSSNNRVTNKTVQFI